MTDHISSMTLWHNFSLLMHILALAMWLGAMLFFLIVYGPAVHQLKPELGLDLLNRGRIKFEALSWVAIGLLLITGMSNLVLRSQSVGGHLGQQYLTVLGIKLLLFLAMLVHHALQVFKYGPKIAFSTPAITGATETWPEPLRAHWSKWFMLLKLNATLGAIATLLGLALISR